MANAYKNAKKYLTTNSATVLYTAPSLTTSIVKSIIVSEASGSADTITVTLTDAASSPATFSLFKTKSIGANATAELLSAPLILTTGEILKITAATANRLYVVASILEIS